MAWAAPEGGAPLDEALVRLPPVRFGGLEVAGVPASGILLALAFLLAIALAVRLARHRELRARNVVELHVAAAVAGLVASKVPAAARSWSDVASHPSALVDLLAAPSSAPAALAGAALVAGALAWASGRVRDTTDVLAPGGALLFAAAWAGAASPARDVGLGLVLVVLGAAIAHALARAPRVRGESALVAVEACGLGVALARLGRLLQDGPSAGDVAAGCVVVAALVIHLALQRPAAASG